VSDSEVQVVNVLMYQLKHHHRWKRRTNDQCNVEIYNVPLDTLQVISQMIFPSQSLDWCKKQSFWPITWLVLVNQI